MTSRLLLAIQKDMADIPAGRFRMGDLSGNGESNERPVHEVAVQAFRLGRHEVTFDQYDTYAVVAHKTLPSDQGYGRGNRPVINVSWEDAQAFIAWLNQQSGLKYRLPSEAEWEYVARSDSTTDYSWGASFDTNLANGAGTSGRDVFKFTAPVGSFPPNAWGLYDMIGNVWELTQDSSHNSYDGAPSDGSARTAVGYTLRMNRGGSWYSYPEDLRVSNRWEYGSTSYDDSLGFRLAQDP